MFSSFVAAACKRQQTAAARTGPAEIRTELRQSWPWKGRTGLWVLQHGTGGMLWGPHKCKSLFATMASRPDWMAGAKASLPAILCALAPVRLPLADAVVPLPRRCLWRARPILMYNLFANGAFTFCYFVMTCVVGTLCGSLLARTVRGKKYPPAALDLLLLRTIVLLASIYPKPTAVAKDK